MRRFYIAPKQDMARSAYSQSPSEGDMYASYCSEPEALNSQMFLAAPPRVPGVHDSSNCREAAASMPGAFP